MSTGRAGAGARAGVHVPPASAVVGPAPAGATAVVVDDELLTTRLHSLCEMLQSDMRRDHEEASTQLLHMAIYEPETRVAIIRHTCPVLFLAISPGFSSLKVQTDGVQTVAFCAQEYEARAEIATHLLPGLTALIDPAVDKAVSQAAVGAVSSLVLEPTLCEQFVSGGGAVRLVHLLQHEGSSLVLINVLALMLRMAAIERMRLLLVALGSIDLISPLIDHEDPSVKKNANHTLHELGWTSLLEDNSSVNDHSQVLSTLLDMGFQARDCHLAIISTGNVCDVSMLSLWITQNESSSPFLTQQRKQLDELEAEKRRTDKRAQRTADVLNLSELITNSPSPRTNSMTVAAVDAVCAGISMEEPDENVEHHLIDGHTSGGGGGATAGGATLRYHKTRRKRGLHIQHHNHGNRRSESRDELSNSFLDEHFATLIDMGFPEDAIRASLGRCANFDDALVSLLELPEPDVSSSSSSSSGVGGSGSDTISSGVPVFPTESAETQSSAWTWEKVGENRWVAAEDDSWPSLPSTSSRTNLQGRFDGGEAAYPVFSPDFASNDRVEDDGDEEEDADEEEDGPDEGDVEGKVSESDGEPESSDTVMTSTANSDTLPAVVAAVARTSSGNSELDPESLDRVASWLKKNRFGKYRRKFREEGVDEEALMMMDRTELPSLVGRAGDRLKMWRLIAQDFPNSVAARDQARASVDALNPSGESQDSSLGSPAHAGGKSASGAPVHMEPLPNKSPTSPNNGTFSSDGMGHGAVRDPVNAHMRPSDSTDLNRIHFGLLQAVPLRGAEAPGESRELRMDHERDVILDALSDSNRRINFRFDYATPSNFVDMISRRIPVLHISGHGHPRSLVLENGKGNVVEWSSDKLKQIISSPLGVRQRLVFVSACHSSGSGESFADAGVPHVIAVREDSKISDRTALCFTVQFYKSLFSGETVRDAFENALKHVRALENGSGCCCAHLHEPSCHDCRKCRKPMCCKLHAGTCHDALSCCKPDTPHAADLKFVLLPEGGNHDVSIFGGPAASAVPLGRCNNRSVSPPPSNLPSPPDHFKGRLNTACEVIKLVCESRVTSLFGSEGVGKSALATFVGDYANSRRCFRDGVFVVDIEGCTTEEELMRRTMKSLNLRTVHGSGGSSNDFLFSTDSGTPCAPTSASPMSGHVLHGSPMSGNSCGSSGSSSSNSGIGSSSPPKATRLSSSVDDLAVPTSRRGRSHGSGGITLVSEGRSGGTGAGAVESGDRPIKSRSVSASPAGDMMVAAAGAGVVEHEYEVVPMTGFYTPPAPHGSGMLLYMILRFLRDKNTLLLWDNCDAFTSSRELSKTFTQLIKTFVSSCKRLSMLLTMRRPDLQMMDVINHRFFPVTPLDMLDSAYLFDHRKSRPIDPRRDFESDTSAAKQWESGRQPWYLDQKQKGPLIIGVTGGTASGKTTVCQKVVELLGLRWVLLLSMDRFYRSLSPEEIEQAHRGDYNFDHPSSFDWPAIRETLVELRSGRRVDVPRYDFATHSRLDVRDKLYGADVIIFEGIFVLYDQEVRSMLDMQIFVDTDSDLRLARRLRRDIVERGRTVEGVLDQYIKTVKPSFDEFIAPTKRYADIIIPRGGDNIVAIELLAQHIRLRLHERGVNSLSGAFTHSPRGSNAGFGSSNSSSRAVGGGNGGRGRVSGKKHGQLWQTHLPDSVSVLQQSTAVRLLHTVLRNRDTGMADFVECVDRVSVLVFERALSLLPTTPVQVSTPTGGAFDAVDMDWSKVCAVSVVRGGNALEATLVEMCPDVRVGKLVVQQTDAKVEGPRFYFSKLPKLMDDCIVMLLTPVVSTANKCIMAVHVLLDHGVKEENIIVVTLVAAPQGIKMLTEAFAKIRLVCSAMDESLDANLFSTPGLGPFGDRYFGPDIDSEKWWNMDEQDEMGGARYSEYSSTAMSAASSSLENDDRSSGGDVGVGGHGAAGAQRDSLSDESDTTETTSCGDNVADPKAKAGNQQQPKKRRRHRRRKKKE